MRPDIPVFLGGEKYNLRPTIKALIDIENEIGQPISAIGSQIGIKTACIFVKNTIRTTDGDRLTPQEWDHVLDVAELDEIINAVTEIVKEIAPNKNGNGGGHDTKK